MVVACTSNRNGSSDVFEAARTVAAPGVGVGVASARYEEERGKFPSNRPDIESLPGVGQYIANAICLFALEQSEPLLDVNMARVLERCFGPRRLADIRYDPSLQQVARIIVTGPKSIQINWAILDLASLVCTRKNPACVRCPLLTTCAEGQRRLGCEHTPKLGDIGSDRGRKEL